jgi:predicted ester cyclase
VSLEENKALVRRFNEEAFNQGDVSAGERYLAPDVFNHVSGKRGIEDFQRIVRYVRAAFPDGRSTFDQVIAEGDRVMILITSTGTHGGEIQLPGRTIPPSGKPVSWQSVHIYRIAGGKIAEHWAVRDDLTLLRQVGASPASSQGAS